MIEYPNHLKTANEKVLWIRQQVKTLSTEAEPLRVRIREIENDIQTLVHWDRNLCGGGWGS